MWAANVNAMHAWLCFAILSLPTAAYTNQPCTRAPSNSVMILSCPRGMTIASVAYAAYGKVDTATARVCVQRHETDTPSNPHVVDIVEGICKGEEACSLFVSDLTFPGLAVAHCRGRACLPDMHATARVVCQASEKFAADAQFAAWSQPKWPAARAAAAIEGELVRSFLASAPAYPEDAFSGRGIVIVAGGRYLNDAMVTIAAIRSYGCTLRIQVWYLGEAEMPVSARPFLAKYSVDARNILDYTSEVVDIESNVGFRPFQLKPLALMHTDLQHVLLLDADSTPTRDPTFLFQAPQYAETGTLFWPDYWKTPRANPIWDVLGVPFHDTWEQESGQLVVDKRRAWAAVSLCAKMQNGFYYSLLNGDKDTFRFAWLAAGVPFTMNPFWPAAVGVYRDHDVVVSAEAHAQQHPRPRQDAHEDADGFCGHTMGQHDFEGSILFVHHNQIKLQGAGSRALLSPGKNFAAVQDVNNRRARSSMAGAVAAPHRVLPLPEVVANGRKITCLTVQMVEVDTGLLHTPDPMPSASLRSWELGLFEVIANVEAFFVTNAAAMHSGGPGADGADAVQSGALQNGANLSATHNTTAGSTFVLSSGNVSVNVSLAAKGSAASVGGIDGIMLRCSEGQPSKQACSGYPYSRFCTWASTLTFPDGQCVLSKRVSLEDITAGAPTAATETVEAAQATPSTQVTAAVRYKIGDRVIASWKGRGTYYPGTIAQEHGTASDRAGHTFTILYDDGETEGGVELARIVALPTQTVRYALGDRVMVNWKGRGTYYPGTIAQEHGTASNRAGHTFTILYHNGETEDSVGVRHIVAVPAAQHKSPTASADNVDSSPSTAGTARPRPSSSSTTEISTSTMTKTAVPTRFPLMDVTSTTTSSTEPPSVAVSSSATTIAVTIETTQAVTTSTTTTTSTCDVRNNAGKPARWACLSKNHYIRRCVWASTAAFPKGQCVPNPPPHHAQRPLMPAAAAATASLLGSDERAEDTITGLNKSSGVVIAVGWGLLGLAVVVAGVVAVLLIWRRTHKDTNSSSTSMVVVLSVTSNPDFMV